MTPFPLPAVPFDGRSRTVALDSVFDWYRQGWSIFAAHPGHWLLTTLGVVVGYCLLAALPTVGRPSAQMLLPTLAAGLLLGCRNVATAAVRQASDLLAIPRGQGPLPWLMLGGLYLLCSTAIQRLVALAVESGAQSAGPSTRILDAAPSLGSWLIAGALEFMLSLPLLMALLFAPALVVFARLRPMSALNASFQACIKNIVAFLIYGVILLTLGFLAVLPAGLGLLVLVPVLAGSVYAAYRDIFLAT
ncbi:MAG: hypothetical protein JNL84_07225 [Candidatus Accumulibacter sp.]|nr:hypothetical protein [Accumulibacter sp.]